MSCSYLSKAETTGQTHHASEKKDLTEGSESVPETGNQEV
jgi:hypothetical protein